MRTQSDQQARGERFRALHVREHGFVIPNPWDGGSARVFEGLGFQALATTSSGCAQTLGRLDRTVTRAEMLAHCRALCAATDLPVSADLENGFGHSPESVQTTIAAAAETGLVGGSVEDFDGEGIYPHEQAVERVHAAVEAANALSAPFVLTARAENLLHGVDDLDDTVRRLQAFEAVGAEVLYAPGLRTLEQVRTVCASVSRPVNVLAPQVQGADLAALTAAGAQRLSVGGALALLSMKPVVEAAREMLEHGTFSWTDQLPDALEARRHLS